MCRILHYTTPSNKQTCSLDQLGEINNKRVFFHINVPPHSHRISKLGGSYLSVDKRLICFHTLWLVENRIRTEFFCYGSALDVAVDSVCFWTFACVGEISSAVSSHVARPPHHCSTAGRVNVQQQCPAPAATSTCSTVTDGLLQAAEAACVGWCIVHVPTAVLQLLGAAGDQEPVADTSAAVSTAAACQHSAALAPVSGHSGWRPQSHSETENFSIKYLPFTTKILHLWRQIIANYINVFRSSWFSCSVISINDTLHSTSQSICKTLKNYLPSAKNICKRVSGWLGVWVCSSSLVSWCHCGALGCSRPPVQHPAGSMASWSSHLSSPRHGMVQSRVEVSISSANLTNFIGILKLWDRERTSFESLLFYLFPRFPLDYKINCVA